MKSFKASACCDITQPLFRLCEVIILSQLYRMYKYLIRNTIKVGFDKKNYTTDILYKVKKIKKINSL